MNEKPTFLQQSEWRLIRAIPRSSLDLELTLFSGQCFNWLKQSSLFKTKISENAKERYFGVLNKSVIELRSSEVSQSNDGTYQLQFCMWTDGPVQADLLDRTKVYLDNYFQFDLINLEQKIAEWSAQDKIFGFFCQGLSGLRVLQQERFECFISYICSQNNNFQRIQSLVGKIKERYGVYLGHIKLDSEIDGQESVAFYAFPSFEQLSNKVKERDLAEMGFGYRAKYIVQACERLSKHGGDKYLDNIANLEESKIQDALCEFNGIGKKVADCIALFSLSAHNAIGVDTHVLQITKKFYPKLTEKSGSLTPKIYNGISEFYKKKFGEHAGWAANILFAANRSLGLAKDASVSAKTILKKNSDSTIVKKTKRESAVISTIIKTTKRIKK
jgi:N-glycosylase/DNA lyase